MQNKKQTETKQGNRTKQKQNRNKTKQNYKTKPT